jgi:hypothetical protein
MMPMVKLLMLLLPASLSSMVGARATRDYQLLDRSGMPIAMGGQPAGSFGLRLSDRELILTVSPLSVLHL